MTEIQNAERQLLIRPKIGSVSLSIVTAVYVLFVLNQTFWLKAAGYLATDLTALAALGIGLAGGFIAIFTTFSLKYLIKPFLIFCVMSAALASWFTDRFGVIIDTDMIRNATTTTTAEAQHLITPGFIWHVFLYGILPSLLIVWVEVVHHTFWRKAGRNLLVFVPALAIFLLAGYSHFKTFAATFREHRELARIINPIMPVGSVIKYAIRSTTERNIVAAPLGTDARKVPPANGWDKPRVTIIVAGETARAKNFSLNGYERETNPELAKLDIVNFPHTSSCGTATAVSLPCMFSVYTRQDYTHRKGLETENVTDVLSHAGVDVAWWDNNTGAKSVDARIASIDLSPVADPHFCTNGECQDGILLDRLDAWLDQVKEDSVLILHQIGSHGPAYFARYPEQFRRFRPDCRTAEFSACTPEEIVNAYDNTILFTDHVLAGIISKLKARSGQMATAMFYMSDHGESLGENGLYLHATPYFIAPDEQTKVPFILWMDANFRSSMGLDTACLTQTATAERSHDNLFHSVLGMMNVSTRVYDPALDVFAACRSKPLS